LERNLVPHGIAQSLRLIGEFKGKQDLFQQQTPQVLETLRQRAIIQSTESSNRIEQVTAPIERIRDLVARGSKPRNRSEQEIAGYRDVLATIHTNYANMQLSIGLVRQMHRDMYAYTPNRGGEWKVADNQIVERGADGQAVVRFKPVPAFATPDAMEQLQAGLIQVRNEQKVEPLLLIAAYILDFLCIHPFLDGNGRTARLLTLLMLYQAGYQVGRYISLERIIEQTKESYYDALARSSVDWHDGQHSLKPWTEYLLGVIMAAYRELEQRVGQVTSARGAKRHMIADAIDHIAGEFSTAELQELCPMVSIDLIRKVLREGRQQGLYECLGRGPKAKWRRL
jgi:Fic family protein